MTWDGKERRKINRRAKFNSPFELSETKILEKVGVVRVDNVVRNNRRFFERRGQKTVEELNEFLKTQIGLAPEFLGKAIFKFLGKETNEQAS